MTEPLRAGLDAELTLPSSWITAAFPRPEESAVKMAGAASATETGRASDTTSRYCTCTDVLGCPSRLYGVTALIWLAWTKVNGAGTPSNNTCVPARVLSTSPAELNTALVPGVGPSEVPKMLTSSPGASGP